MLIRNAIARTLFMMLSSPPPFGIRGIFYLAREIERLDRSRDGRYILLFLGHMIRMQEETRHGRGRVSLHVCRVSPGSVGDPAFAVLQEASVKMDPGGGPVANLCAGMRQDHPAARRRSGPEGDRRAAPPVRCGEMERDVYVLLKKGI